MNEVLNPLLNKKINVYDLINDSYKEYLWGLRFVQLERTWLETDNNDLSKIKVAIIDSGIDYNHEDLENIDIDKSYNFVDDSCDIMDSYGHGTSVAGVIAAQRNNSVGIAGVASGVTMIPFKVTDNNGRADIKNVIKSLECSIENKVDIINLSMGHRKNFFDTLNNSSLLYDKEYKLIKEALKRNIVVVSAVGNNGGLDIDFPASMTEVVSVASYGIINNPLQVFYNPQNSATNESTLFAPGVAIFTTLPGNKYKYVSGTSIATAFVTGAIALLKTKYYDASPKFIYDLLLNGSDKIRLGGEQMNLLNIDKAYSYN